MSAEDPREREIEQLLRRSMRAGADAGAGCLDAETLAAWGEGSMRADAARAVEAHAAGCARCQAVLAAFVRAEPVSAQPADVPGRSPSIWTRWRMYGLVPIAATAVAIAVWVATPSRTEMPSHGETPSRSATPSRGELPARGPGDRSTPPPSSSAPAAAEAPPASPPRREQRAAAAPAAPPADAERVGAVGRPAPSLDGEGLAEKRSAPTESSGANRAEAARSRDAAPEADGPAAAASTAGPAPAGGLEVAGEDGVRWRTRYSPQEARAEFSADGGRTWAAATIPDEAVRALVSGVSPGGRVSWFVGRGGTVLLTTDGLTFRQLAFPERSDLQVVEAFDGRRARVETAGGRAFTTSDAGSTWVPER